MFAAFFQLLLYILASLGVVKVIEELKKTKQIRKLMRTEGWRKWRRFRRHVLESWVFKKLQGIMREVFTDNDYVFIQLPLPPRASHLMLKMTFHDLMNNNFDWIFAFHREAQLYHLIKEINADGFALSYRTGAISFQLFTSTRYSDHAHMMDAAALRVPAILTAHDGRKEWSSVS